MCTYLYFSLKIFFIYDSLKKGQWNCYSEVILLVMMIRGYDGGKGLELNDGYTCFWIKQQDTGGHFPSLPLFRFVFISRGRETHLEHVSQTRKHKLTYISLVRINREGNKECCIVLVSQASFIIGCWLGCKAWVEAFMRTCSFPGCLTMLLVPINYLVTLLLEYSLIVVWQTSIIYQNWNYLWHLSECTIISKSNNSSHLFLGCNN